MHPQSKTDQPVYPRTESDWNDLNDRHSSIPISRMLDDAYVLKNPEKVEISVSQRIFNPFIRVSAVWH